MTRDEFSTLALTYMDQLMSYARRLTGTPWDADDIVQGTYEKAFQSWEALRDAASCRAWLFRIAHNLHVDRIRSNAARPELHLVDPSTDEPLDPPPPPKSFDRLDALALEGALDHLAEDQREVILLSDLWGFRYDEIASVLSIPIGTVRSRISRARSRLLSLLTPEARSLSGRRRPA